MLTQDPDRRLAHLRELFKHLESECRALVYGFEILRPTAEPGELVSRFAVNTPQARGFLEVRMALFNQCILNCWRILSEDGENNPSFRNLCRPFLRGNRKKHEHNEVLRLLEADFSSPVESVGSPPNFLRILQAQERDKAEARRARFWQHADRIADLWSELKSTRQAMEKVRNRWIGHFELVPQNDPVAGLRLVEHTVGTQQEIYHKLCAAMTKITELIELLALVLHSKSAGMKEVQRYAMQDLAAYWSLTG